MNNQGIKDAEPSKSYCSPFLSLLFTFICTLNGFIVVADIWFVWKVIFYLVFTHKNFFCCFRGKLSRHKRRRAQQKFCFVLSLASIDSCLHIKSFQSGCRRLVCLRKHNLSRFQDIKNAMPSKCSSSPFLSLYLLLSTNLTVLEWSPTFDLSRNQHICCFRDQTTKKQKTKTKTQSLA